MANENEKQTLLLQLRSLSKPYTRCKLINYVSRQMQVTEGAAKVMVDNSLLYSVRSDMIVCFGSALAYIKTKPAVSRKTNHNNKNNDDQNERFQSQDHVAASDDKVKTQSDR